MTRVAEMVASAPSFGVTGLGDVAAGDVVDVDGVWHRPNCVCPSAQAVHASPPPEQDSRRQARRRSRSRSGRRETWTFDDWARRLPGPLVAPCCSTLSERSSEVFAAVNELSCARQFLDTGCAIEGGSFSDMSPKEKVRWLCHVLDLSSVVVSAAENACSRAAKLFDTDSPADMYVAAEFRSAANGVAVETAALVSSATARCEDPDLVPELCSQLVLSSSPRDVVDSMMLDHTATMFAVPVSKLSGSRGVLVRAGAVSVRDGMIVSVLPFFAAMSVLPSVSSPQSWNHVTLVPGVSLASLTVAAGLFEANSSGPLASLSTAVSAAISLVDVPALR